MRPLAPQCCRPQFTIQNSKFVFPAGAVGAAAGLGVGVGTGTAERLAAVAQHLDTKSRHQQCKTGYRGD